MGERADIGRREVIAIFGPATVQFLNPLLHLLTLGSGGDLAVLTETAALLPMAALAAVVREAVAANPAARHVILLCSAVNAIDASALESLEAILEQVKVDPLNWRTWDSVGDRYHPLGRYDEARAAWLKSSALRGATTNGKVQQLDYCLTGRMPSDTLVTNESERIGYLVATGDIAGTVVAIELLPDGYTPK